MAPLLFPLKRRIYDCSRRQEPMKAAYVDILECGDEEAREVGAEALGVAVDLVRIEAVPTGLETRGVA